MLNWTPEDFFESECAEDPVNNGGCPGREVSPDGKLVPAGQPRDLACVAAWRAQHLLPSPLPDPLFEVMDHGRGGYIDRAGAIVIPLCFDTVSEFSEGLARFERDGRWGYLDTSGAVVIQPRFPWAEDFHEGLAHVQVTGESLGLDGTWGYINNSGQMVIAPTHGRMMSDDDGRQSAFHEGLAIAESESESLPPKQWFIDTSGKMVIPARFTYVYPFSEGLAAATESKSGDNGWGFLDKSGNWAILPTLDDASSFDAGLAPASRQAECGYVDKTGAFVLGPPAPTGGHHCLSAVGHFADGLSRWLFGNKYGFIDRTGKIVIDPRFDLTDGFSEGLAAVQIDKKWGYIDTTGKMVVAPRDLSSAKPFHNGLAEIVTQDGKWGYIDHTGKPVWSPRLQGRD